MARRIKDLTPKMSIPIAEVELAMPMGEVEMGQRVGGLSMFSNALKRGYGNQTFGVDENGMWLGAADFENGPFKVDIQGRATLTSADGKAIKISAPDNTIIVNDGTNDIILIGYQENGF